jgi:hypothetical protein
MNQAVQVLDGCTYIAIKEALKVDVIEAGQMLACYICGLNKEGLTSLYNTKQFEIEEIIEHKLLHGQLNLDGEIWLTAEEVSAY